MPETTARRTLPSGKANPFGAKRPTSAYGAPVPATAADPEPSAAAAPAASAAPVVAAPAPIERGLAPGPAEPEPEEARAAGGNHPQPDDTPEPAARPEPKPRKASTRPKPAPRSAPGPRPQVQFTLEQDLIDELDESFLAFLLANRDWTREHGKPNPSTYAAGLLRLGLETAKKSPSALLPLIPEDGRRARHRNG